MTSFAKRLKELRKSLGLTQAELAKFLSSSASTIGMYEQGRRTPPYEGLEEIADFFNVDMDYLMGKSDKTTILNPSRIASLKLSNFSNNTLQIMLELNLDGQSKVYEYARDIKLTGNYDTDKSMPPLTLSEDYIELYTDARAAAGTGAYNYGYDDGRCVCAKIADVPDYDGIVDVKGDSMNPTIKDGDVAFVDFNFEPVDGKIYIIQHEDDTYIKRCYFESDKLTLKSDNPDYKDIVFNTYDNVRIIGLVTGWATPEQ